MTIGEHIGEVVASMRSEENGAPYYMYGHRAELNSRLMAMDKKVSEKNRKFPLIILILDVPEVQTNDIVHYDLHLAIMTYVKDRTGVTAEDILTNTIEAVLYPLYEDFITALVDSGKFVWSGDPTSPSHTKFDRPRWGTPTNEKNEAQYFDYAVDAVEVVNLQLNLIVCRDENEEESSTDNSIITAQGMITVPDIAAMYTNYNPTVITAHDAVYVP